MASHCPVPNCEIISDASRNEARIQILLARRSRPASRSNEFLPLVASLPSAE